MCEDHVLSQSHLMLDRRRPCLPARLLNRVMYATHSIVPFISSFPGKVMACTHLMMATTQMCLEAIPRPRRRRWALLG